MIRAAIIGLGTWGQNLVRSVPPDSPHIRFTAFATRTPEKARDFAASRGLRMLASYEAALADPDIDAVVLATPHSLHTGPMPGAEAMMYPHAGQRPRRTRTNRRTLPGT